MKRYIMKLIPLLAALAIITACSTSEDDLIFTDFELEFIEKNLSWDGALPDDPTNAYDTDENAAILGQWVWFDERFSGEIKNVENPLYGDGGTSSEGQVSCNTCHVATDFFIDQVSNPDEASLGTDWTPRHTPTVLNTAYQDYVGWDGRKDSTWSMTLAPFEAGAVQNYGRLSIANLMCNNTDYNTQYNLVFTDNTLDSAGTLCTAITAATTDCGYEATVKGFDSSAVYSGQTATDLDTLDGEDADGNPLAYYLTGAAGAYTTAGPHIYVAANDNWDRLRTDSECYADTDEPEANRTGTAAIDALCVDPAGSLVYGKSSDKCFSGDGSQLTADQQTEVNRIFANVGKALAAYERLLVDKDSEFDKWVAGDSNSFSTDAKLGLKLFISKGNCIHCHNGPRFTDDDFHNIGVPQGGFAKRDDTGRFDGISTLLGDTFNTAGEFNDDSSVDRTNVTAKAADEGAFKTPSLRSIAGTAPYMHTGGIGNLWDVVEFYNFGGANDNFPGSKDSAMIPRELTDEEISQLVEFLNALTGATLDSSLTEARSDQP